MDLYYRNIVDQFNQIKMFLYNRIFLLLDEINAKLDLLLNRSIADRPD